MQQSLAKVEKWNKAREEWDVCRVPRNRLFESRQLLLCRRYCCQHAYVRMSYVFSACLNVRMPFLGLVNAENVRDIFGSKSC